MTSDVETIPPKARAHVLEADQEPTMAQFRLPPSTLGSVEGTTHKATPTGATEVRTFRIYRFDPGFQVKTSRVDEFRARSQKLWPDGAADALIQIKASIDSTLTFRRSCRVKVSAAPAP